MTPEQKLRKQLNDLVIGDEPNSTDILERALNEAEMDLTSGSPENGVNDIEYDDSSKKIILKLINPCLP